MLIVSSHRCSNDVEKTLRLMSIGVLMDWITLVILVVFPISDAS